MGKDDTESVKNNKHVNAVCYDCLPQHHATGTGDGTATWQASASFVHQRLWEGKRSELQLLSMPLPAPRYSQPHPREEGGASVANL